MTKTLKPDELEIIIYALELTRDCHRNAIDSAADDETEQDDRRRIEICERLLVSFRKMQK